MRNHIHEARIAERLDQLGYTMHKGAMPLREQADELRVIERVLRQEAKLPKNNESFSALMKRARRRG